MVEITNTGVGQLRLSGRRDLHKVIHLFIFLFCVQALGIQLGTTWGR